MKWNFPRNIYIVIIHVYTKTKVLTYFLEEKLHYVLHVQYQHEILRKFKVS